MCRSFLIMAVILLCGSCYLASYATDGNDTNDTNDTRGSDWTTLTSRVVHLEEVHEREGGSVVELFLENGMVALLKNPTSEALALVRHGKFERTYYDFFLKRRDFEILYFKQAKSVEGGTLEDEECEQPLPLLDTKSNLKRVVSYDEAVNLFSKMHPNFVGSRRVFRRNPSQCFRRAQVWTYEFERDFGVESRKYFLMFTGKFRSGGCSYNWWFHVTPYLSVAYRRGEVVPLTMDREYAAGPIDRDSWSRLFVNSTGGGCNVPRDVVCPVISENQYDVYKREYNRYYCIIIDTARFYYYPEDMEEASRSGRVRSSWNMNNVNDAYTEKR
ncbi:MAG: hypothetical protein HQK50_16575 [Oligoflexia bacterium]|nr:hypothetical protein [Oligoflexia bacterium]MBF0367193.1 hypothetical protein [Oligoflexia bacterium]